MAIAAFCRLEKLISRDRIKRYGSRDVGYKPTTRSYVGGQGNTNIDC